MIQAQTREADDPQAAAASIVAQVMAAGPLSRHACGVVHCDNAFLETGALLAVSRALPFPTVGINTLLHSTVSGALSSTLLTVTVLTSPDVRMSVALSEHMGEDVRGPCESLFFEALSGLKEKPSAGFMFVPFLQWCPAGELITQTLDSASGNIPLFGTVAADYSDEFRSPRVLFNGCAWSSRSALILFGAAARPRFSIYPVSAKKTVRGKAVVTESEAHIVRRINGMPVLDFLETLGLCTDGKLECAYSIPLFLERGGGRPPIVRSMLAQTADGAIVLGGNVPPGSTLGIGAMDTLHIIEGVRRAASLMSLSAPGAAFLYSCLFRGVCLGLNYTSEMETLRRDLAGRVPYTFAYSGGEICPMLLPDGKWHNEFHNMSLVAMFL
ncbi:MAG: FIST C-terminal domain-containing protein [Deltaproteobacteria bacterium]|jgi:hypothetical protein|nr:FIST C-terminal domain-containing protein [Deltaproteobacteria bacterium]